MGGVGCLSIVEQLTSHNYWAIQQKHPSSGPPSPTLDSHAIRSLVVIEKKYKDLALKAQQDVGSSQA